VVGEGGSAWREVCRRFALSKLNKLRDVTQIISARNINHHLLKVIPYFNVVFVFKILYTYYVIQMVLFI